MANFSLECCRGRLLSRAPRFPQHVSRRQNATEHLGKTASEESFHQHTRSLSSSLVRVVNQNKNRKNATVNRDISQGNILNKMMWYSHNAKNILQASTMSSSRLIDTLNLELPSKVKVIANKLYNIRGMTANEKPSQEMEQPIIAQDSVKDDLNNSAINDTVANSSEESVCIEPRPKIPYHQIYDESKYVREQHSLEDALSKKYDGVQTYYSQIVLPHKLNGTHEENNLGLNYFSLEQRLAAADQKVEDLIRSSNEKKELDNQTGSELTVTDEPLDIPQPSTTQRILRAASETIPSNIISGITERIPKLPYINLPTKKEEGDKPSLKKVKSKVLAKRTVKIPQSEIEKKTRELSITFTWATTQRSKFSRLEELCQHLAAYPETRAIAIEENVIPVLLCMRESRDVAAHEQANQALALLGYVNPVKGRGIRILSIDGGGIRGLIALEIMRQLEQYSGKCIHEMFDMITGVSTGALLATLIGVNNAKVDDIIGLYRGLGKELFAQSRLPGITNLVRTHAYYSHDLWEKILRANVGDSTFLESMKKKNSPKIITVSSIMNVKHVENFVFRNYEYPVGQSSRYPGSFAYSLIQGVRASSAAPGYYKDYHLDDNLHIDGGFGANNPTAVAIHECKNLWPNQDIQCVVSLGTGRFVNTPTSGVSSVSDKIDKLIKAATDTQGTHATLQDMMPPDTYFRFNPYISEDITLDETRDEKWEQMINDAEMYCNKNKKKFESCAKQLLLEKTRYQQLTEYAKLNYDKHHHIIHWNKKKFSSKL